MPAATCRLRSPITRRALAYILILAMAGPAAGADEAPVPSQVAEAEGLYNAGRFDDALRVLSEFLATPGLSREDQEQAFRLAGYTYIAKDLRDDARRTIARLLELVPNYEPDPEQDLPPYIQIVNEVKAEIARERALAAEERGRGWLKWALVGAGVLVTGGLALMLSGGGQDSGTTLPGPPGLPQ